MTAAPEFLYGVTEPGRYPRWSRVEVALAGRSNVGKSSLLNALTRRAKLARISKTPGRTRALNFFGIDEKGNLVLVDLPGYGYAKIAKTEAAALGALMTDYLTTRRQLAALVLLVDSRRGPQDAELELVATATEGRLLAGNQPASIIVAATKCDKLSRAERQTATNLFHQRGIEPVLCSTTTGEGVDQLRAAISRAAKLPFK